MYDRPLKALAIMVLHPQAYLASNSDENNVIPSQSTDRAIEICTNVLRAYSKDIKKVRNLYLREHSETPGKELTDADMAKMFIGLLQHSK
jgi:hypothetical protein